MSHRARVVAWFGFLALAGLAACQSSSADGGSSCGQLSACCAQLGASASALCSTTVSDADESVCLTELGSYRSVGQCGGTDAAVPAFSAVPTFSIGTSTRTTPGSSSGATDTSAPPSTSHASSGASSSGGGALTILDFSRTLTTMTEMDTVTFSVIVADSTGLDQIAGGTLTDSTGANYGGLTAGTQKSTMEISLTWAQISEVNTLQFDVPASLGRTFVATVYDNSGNKAVASESITFECSTAGFGACAGVCVDLGNPAHCGTCSNACGGAQGCSADGSCVTAALQTCFVVGASTCAAYCSTQGKSCVEGCADGSDFLTGAGQGVMGSCMNGALYGTTFDLTTCNESLASYQGASCCCL